MNNIRFEVDGKSIEINVPETFDEIKADHFPDLTKMVYAVVNKKLIDDTLYARVLGLEKKMWDRLTFFQKYQLRALFDWIFDTEEHISKRQFIETITIDGEEYVGYQDAFGNTSWQEFIYADQYLINSRFREMAAVLYRPKRKDYDGETDIRIPFTMYGTGYRLPKFVNLDDATIYALVMNYRMMRRASLESRYDAVFPYHEKSTTDDDDEPTTADQFSWVKVHRNIMSDKFYMEEKFLESNVHTVIHRMNTVIEENRKNKKGT